MPKFSTKYILYMPKFSIYTNQIAILTESAFFSINMSHIMIPKQGLCFNYLQESKSFQMKIHA